MASSYCRNDADRPDLIQEIAVQLWRSFDRYDERHRFSTWMYGIALNVAISFYRSESRRKRDTVPAEDSILEIADDRGVGTKSNRIKQKLRDLARTAA